MTGPCTRSADSTVYGFMDRRGFVCSGVIGVWLLVGCGILSSPPDAAALQARSLSNSSELAVMRESLEIPGMSAAISERGEIIWGARFRHRRSRTVHAGHG